MKNRNFFLSQITYFGLIILFICWILHPSHALAAKIKEGEKVMVTDPKAKIMQGTKEISGMTLGDVLLVTQVKGNWLGIVSQKGWILEKQVVPISQAADYFTKKIKEKPLAGYYYLRGIANFASKQNQKAIEDFNEAITRNKQKTVSVYHTNRGIVYVNIGQKEKAMADFTTAIRMNPKDASAYYNRSVIYFDQKEYDKAMTDLDASLAADKKYAPTFNNRGVLWRNRGEYDKAIEDYSQAIKLDKKFASPYTNRGYAKKMQKKYREAKKDYLTAIELSPEDPAPKNDLAWLLATCSVQKQRNGKEAVKQALAACELWDHQNYNGLDTLAAAYAETGQFKKALQWVEKAIKIAPKDAIKNLQNKKKIYQKNKPFHE